MVHLLHLQRRLPLGLYPLGQDHRLLVAQREVHLLGMMVVAPVALLLQVVVAVLGAILETVAQAPQTPVKV